MKKMTMATLAAVAVCGFFGGGTLVSHAEDYSLDTVYVEGERSQDEVGTLPGGFVKEAPVTGFLGKQDVMSTPFSVMEVSQKTIKTFASPANGINDALTFDPSVRISSGSLYQDIAIRGFTTNGHRQYVNGIPGLLCQENIPYYWVDSVSIVSGPNLGVNGSTLSEAVGGSVNYTSKKAVEDATSVKLTYRGGSSFEEGVDFSKRFGDNERYGIRVTTNNVHGETSIEHEKLKQQNFFVNFDQKTTNSKTNLLVGYNHTKHNAGPYGFSFAFDDTFKTLPGAPDASKNYKPSWSYNEYENFIVALNHEQKLSEHATAFVNAGYHKENWYGYIDGSPKIINAAGDYTISLSNYPLFMTKTYVGLGIKGDFKTGVVRHDYVVGVDKNWEYYDLGNNPNWSWKGTGNIYQSNSWANPGLATFDAPHSDSTQLTGWHIVDTMKALEDKLSFTVGLHGHRAVVTAPGTAQKKSDAISPTFALSYQFTPNVMAFVDHTESFGMGSRVSTTSGYKNGGAMLDPAKTKQNEIGVKVKAGNFLNTFSYFQIKQANKIDVTRADGIYQELDGEQENKGFEWAFTGNINKKWDLIGGLMYIDVTQSKTKDHANDGKPVDGMPHWSGTLGAVYHPNSQWDVIGRVSYLDSCFINNGTVEVPSHTVFDFGVAYTTKVAGTPATFHAMLYNAFGKDYWNARGSGTSLTLGAPRTFVLSAEFKF